MRIIRAAKRIQEARITCPNCESILGIEKEDIKYMDMSYKVFCPVCQTWIGDFNKEILFPWVMEDEKKNEEIQSSDAVRKY